jgi:hypothetical protein
MDPMTSVLITGVHPGHASSSKIRAIKALRSARPGMSLRQAKEYMDTLMGTWNPSICAYANGGKPITVVVENTFPLDDVFYYEVIRQNNDTTAAMKVAMRALRLGLTARELEQLAEVSPDATAVLLRDAASALREA